MCFGMTAALWGTKPESTGGGEPPPDTSMCEHNGQRGESEEPERIGAVADQHVLGLLVVIQHHLVGFTANT